MNPTEGPTFREHLTKTLGKGLAVASLLGALMIYGDLTGNPDEVEWPTGPTTSQATR